MFQWTYRSNRGSERTGVRHSWGIAFTLALAASASTQAQDVATVAAASTSSSRSTRSLAAYLRQTGTRPRRLRLVGQLLPPDRARTRRSSCSCRPTSTSSCQLADAGRPRSRRALCRRPHRPVRAEGLAAAGRRRAGRPARGLPTAGCAFAIANPEHAPYGRAARCRRCGAGLWDRIKPTLVLGENVSQAAQFAASARPRPASSRYSLALAPALPAGSYTR